MGGQITFGKSNSERGEIHIRDKFQFLSPFVIQTEWMLDKQLIISTITSLIELGHLRMLRLALVDKFYHSSDPWGLIPVGLH